jgi:hypothetical protein
MLLIVFVHFFLVITISLSVSLKCMCAEIIMTVSLDYIFKRSIKDIYCETLKVLYNVVPNIESMKGAPKFKITM